MEAWRLKIEPWRVFRPVVADSHYFDEEQDPDPATSLKIGNATTGTEILANTGTPVLHPRLRN
jgi:hypothetical protein